MRSYNDYKKNKSQSSESDVSDEKERGSPSPNAAKIIKTTNIRKQYERQSESEQSSLSEEEDSGLEQDQQLKKETTKLTGKYRMMRPQDESDSQDQQEESSIDQIQQRIKTLQKNLQMKIDKHKLRPEVKKVDEKPISEVARPIKNASSPPLPKKPDFKVPVATKYHENNKAQNENKQTNNKLHVQRDVPSILKEHQNRPAEINQGQKMANQPKQLKQSPKKKGKGEAEISKNKVQSVGEKEDKKRTNSSNNKKYVDIQASYNLALEKINQLENIVDKLKQQNKELKKTLSQKQKRRPNAELDKLKEISENKDEKLQKQIQLLKVIETLQSKLKKSIQKKMNKNKMGSASLLHKGLPANLN